ncbi:MAG: hypothetical protein MUF02_05475 [Acidobacteria bacterium]|nr:hypothetical protein [Acidobacteriota bacterium]
MITAVIDSGRDNENRLIVRGRSLSFWLELLFPFCRFSPFPASGRFPERIIVFSPSRFASLSDACCRELRRRLRDRNQSQVLAPPGKPFFIVPGSFWRDSGLDLKPGVFRRLRLLSGVAPLELRHPLAILDPRQEPEKIEAAVVALQLRRLRQNGVHIDNFGNFYLEGLPAIGRGSRIGSGAVIRGDCRIGRGATIYANCFIENSQIGDNCSILPGSVIRDSIVEKDVQLGPYCHLRNGSLVCRGAKMGNFVEMKKSVLGRGSKAMHLTYIGDAKVGRGVNVGAGTITCNYDGERKNPTAIGDRVFIGSGTELVAPVTLHSDSYVAAGSTITEDVPRYALAVARQRQRNIKGWVLRKRKK